MSGTRSPAGRRKVSPLLAVSDAEDRSTLAMERTPLICQHKMIRKNFEWAGADTEFT